MTAKGRRGGGVDDHDYDDDNDDGDDDQYTRIMGRSALLTEVLYTTESQVFAPRGFNQSVSQLPSYLIP